MQIVSNIVPSAGVVSPGLDVRDIKSMLNGLTQIERPSSICLDTNFIRKAMLS
jgi:hypothetical protein